MNNAISILCVFGHILLSASSVFAERSKFRLVPFGPCSAFSILITIVYVMNVIGVFTFKNPNSVSGALWFLGSHLAFVTGVLTMALISRRRGVNWLIGYREGSCSLKFVNFYWVLVMVAFMGIGFNIYVMAEFGFSHAFGNMSAFHKYNQNLSQNEGYLVSTVRSVFGTAQPLLPFICVMLWRRLSIAARWFGVVFILYYLGLLFVYGGRGKFVFNALAFILIAFNLKYFGLNYRKLFNVGLGTLVLFAFVFAISARRLSYFSAGGLTMMIQAGAEETKLPPEFLYSSYGNFFTQAYLYTSSPYNKFNILVDEQSEMMPSLGLRSFRLLNPALNFIAPGLAAYQRKANIVNLEYLLGLFSGAAQWPTVFGYFVSDFGLLGSLPFSFLYGFVFMVCVVLSLRRGRGFREVCLFVCYNIGLSAFVIPVTAKQEGLVMLLVFLCCLYLDRQSGGRSFRRPRAVAKRVSGQPPVRHLDGV